MKEQNIPAPWDMAAEYAEHETTATAMVAVRDALAEPLAADGVRVKKEGGGEAQVILHLFPGDERRELSSGLPKGECLHALGYQPFRGTFQTDNVNGKLGSLDNVAVRRVEMQDHFSVRPPEALVPCFEVHSVKCYAVGDFEAGTELAQRNPLPDQTQLLQPLGDRSEPLRRVRLRQRHPQRGQWRESRPLEPREMHRVCDMNMIN